MKLVQLLAKELKEWPVKGGEYNKESDYCVMSDETSQLFFCGSHGKIFLSERADKTAGVSVSRSEWQAEREKMNKPKWIRHRGGNSTLHPGTMVEARLRSGEIQRAIAGAFLWDNSLSDHAVNIMAYRLIEETKDQEIEEVIPKHMAFGYASKEEMVAQIGEECPFAQVASTAEKTNFGTITYKLEIDATEATQQIDSLVAKWGQIESPLKWRDAIIHCQAIIEDCEREIERNVSLLDAEGLMMQKDSKKAMQNYAPDVDMSDWRNWKRGDIISISNDPDIKDGEYKVTSIEEYDYDGDLPVQVTDGWADFSEATVKFVQRP